MKKNTGCRGREVVRRLALERRAAGPELPGSGRHLRTARSLRVLGGVNSFRDELFTNVITRHPKESVEMPLTPPQNPKLIDPIFFELENGTRPLLLIISGSGAWHCAAANTKTCNIGPNYNFSSIQFFP
jgi:hypothetical protein